MQRSTHATTQFKRATVLCAALLLAAGCNKNAQQSVEAAPSAPAAQAPDVQPVSSARTLYPDPAIAKTQISEALRRAKAQHKRVILDFGGNWCGDCQVLDIYFHDPENKALLEDNFELVDINIGRYDANQDIAAHYGIPLQRGVPALVVLSPEGKVLLAQTHGEFESMRHLESSDLTKFLNDWKPKRDGVHGSL